MIAGDNRCVVLASAADRCRNDRTVTTTTTQLADNRNAEHDHQSAAVSAKPTTMTDSAGCKRYEQVFGGLGLGNRRNFSSPAVAELRVSRANIGQEHEQLNKSANELLKLTHLKLHDDNEASETTTGSRPTETTTTTRAACTESKQQSKRTTIEAPAKLLGLNCAELVETAGGGQRRMLVEASFGHQTHQPTSKSSSVAADQHPAESNRMQHHQRQLVDSDSYDYPMHQEAYSDARSQQYEHQHQAAGASIHFGPPDSGQGGYSALELAETNYAAYGAGAGQQGDYLALSGQHHQLEFLELEPSQESRVHLQNSKILYHHHHQQQHHHHQQQQQTEPQAGSANFADAGSQHPYDTGSSASYLSLDPAPASNLSYDAELPDSVIQLNHGQQNGLGQGHSQAQYGGLQEISTIQFAGAASQYSGYTEDAALRHHHHQLQPQSSASCLDGSGSHLLGDFHLRHTQHSRLPGGAGQLAQHSEQRHSSSSMGHSGGALLLAGNNGSTMGQHPMVEPELKVCEWEGCENTFLDMQEFVKHLEDRHVNQKPNEKNRYFCLWSNCKRNEQEFNARYKLLIHMRVHSGEKPYPCNNMNCKKSFSRLENLKIHQRSHTGEKPYRCIFDGCSKSFTNSSDRIKHHKTHKDPKPYSCNYDGCTKRYTDPSSLRKHLRAHKRAQVLPGVQGNCNGGDLHSSSGGSNSELGPGCCSNYEPANLLFHQQQTPTTATPFQHQSFAGRPVSSRLSQTPSITIDHHQNDLNTHNILTYNQQYQQQHSQLSRSWCAGSTGAGDASAAPHRNPQLASHDDSSRFTFETFGHRHNSYQQQPYQCHSQEQRYNHHHHQHGKSQPAAVQQLRTHETLMRSLPLGGFRVPFSRLSHAHAEWPPPSAGGPASGQQQHQYQQQEQQY